MKTRTISRILEGIFLFTLILLIYILSIFSAKGQMSRELVAPSELMLSYTNEESFLQERIKNLSFEWFELESNESKQVGNSPYIPDYLKEKNESIKHQILLPKTDMRRRRIKEYQAPLLVIPFY